MLYFFQLRNASFMQIFSSRRPSLGLTLVELLIAVGVFGLIIAAISLFITRGTASSRSTTQQARNIEDARTNLTRIQDMIRNAQYPDASTFWLKQAAGNEIIFFANTDDDPEVEQVRYTLNGSSLERGITQPAAAGEDVVVTAKSLQNQAAGQPVFTFLPDAANVERIGIHLVVDHDPAKEPPTLQVDTEATPRLVKALSVTTPMPVPSPIPCTDGKVDLVLVLDGSGSISLPDFALLKDFAKAVVNGFDVNPSEARIGIIQFSTFPQLEAPLGTDSAGLLNTLSAMIKISAGTQIHLAIDAAQSELNTRGRADEKHVIMLLSDGVSSQIPAIASADAAKAAGTDFVTVFVGNYVSGQILLQKIASRPEYYFQVNDFTQLQAIINALINNICPGN